MTKSVTLIFPGQGAQYVGMGQSLEGHPSFEFLNKANQSLDYDLKKIMLSGPEEDLTLTANTQPAILTHSIALFDKAWEILLNKGIKVDRVLGHSVGEYAALVAAKAIDFAIELKVSAPFHSSLMEPAAQKLKAHLDTIEFRPLFTPYIANIDAKEYGADTAGEIVKENLFKQVDGSVRWTQSIEQLPDDTICLEVGPGRVLMGLLRKINRNIKVISLDKDGAFDELKEL